MAILLRDLQGTMRRGTKEQQKARHRKQRKQEIDGGKTGFFDQLRNSYNNENRLLVVYFGTRNNSQYGHGSPVAYFPGTAYSRFEGPFGAIAAGP